MFMSPLKLSLVNIFASHEVLAYNTLSHLHQCIQALFRLVLHPGQDFLAEPAEKG